MSQKPAVFITGAAAGIGRAIAELFANNGWFVGLYDIDGNGVKRLAEQLGEESAMAGKLNVTEPAGWQTALKEFTDANNGQLNLLVNNAGVLETGNFSDISLASHHRMADINFKGVITGCHTAYPYLKQTAGAQVINIASASAIYGTPVFASYSATKFAVRGLTEALNLEWQNAGIRVSDIMPIFVKSNMTEGVHTKSIDEMGINLTPEDIAGTVWKAAHKEGFGKVHWPVGAQTHQLMLAIRLLPIWLVRIILRKLSL